MKKIILSSTNPVETKENPPDDLLAFNPSTSSLSLYEEFPNPDNFIGSTRGNLYDYWFRLADVTDIARVKYNNFKHFKSVSGSLNSYFKTLTSFEPLLDEITSFQENVDKIGSGRMTLIINTGYSRWTVMVLSYKENHEKNFKITYVDSLNSPLRERIHNFFYEKKVLFYDLSEYLYKNMNTCNVGLWVLDIAADLNKMMDEGDDLVKMILEFAHLSYRRDTDYFNKMRKTLAYELNSDAYIVANLVKPSTSGLGKIVTSPSFSSSLIVTIDEPKLKKMKIESKEDALQFRLEVFVENFIKHSSELLTIYHVIAKGDRLTRSSLIRELKTGATGALLGITIAQGIGGSIPALVATTRSISGHYYFSRDKAYTVTRAFETIFAGELSSLLGLVAIDVFYSFESQFMSVTDKAGDKVAMEKLAEDAAARMLNYIGQLDPAPLITRELLSKGVFLGKSEKYFNVNLKKFHIFMSGKSLLNQNLKKISTLELYQQVGVRIVNTDTHEIRCYPLKEKEHANSFEYGYRRLLKWEKKRNGEPKEMALLEKYQQRVLPTSENQANSVLENYEYCLDENKLEEQANSILEKIKSNAYIQPVLVRHQKIAIQFGLRKAVSNFSGRKEVLDNLHELLIADKHIAVVTQDLSHLSLNRPSNSRTNTAQISLSGLGGVGKTQVALRYAELYASHYDNNIIWINAETKNNMVSSFIKLAPLLNIAKKNIFGNDKDIDELLPEIYNFFRDKKSLFIFDNVENYREFEEFLPGMGSGNQPTLLITSRFSHWINILPVLIVDVFTHQEAIEFIKNELIIMTDEYDQKITVLIHLLHRLPLALQQAVAYISMQKYLNSKFSIDDYIILFKEKTEEILKFDFSEHSNDRHVKPVFITWRITLDKIKNDKAGEIALEILNMMAYLYPDHITNKIFSGLKSAESLISAIRLLQNYSMISIGGHQDISVIHRLVQLVVRINLEKDFLKLKKNTENIFQITQNFHNDFELSIHYIYFLLYMNQNNKLSYRLKLGITKNRVMDILICSADKIVIDYLYDAARLILAKQQYFNFIGDALFLYIKHGLLFFLSETISYIEKNLEQGILLKSDVRLILDYRYKAAEEDPANWLAHDPEGRERQIHGVRFVSDFQKKFIFKKSTSCRFRKRKRRDVACLVEASSIEKDKLLFAQSHLKLVANCADLVSLGKMNTETIPPDFFSEKWDQVALHFRNIIESVLLKKTSDINLISEELSMLTQKGLLGKNFSLNSTTALSVFQNKLAKLNKSKAFLRRAMKIAKPFTRLGYSSIGHSYHFAKELKDFKELKRLKAIKEGNIDTSSSPMLLSDVTMPDSDHLGIDIVKALEGFILPIAEPILEPEEYVIKKSMGLGLWLVNSTYQAIRQINQIESYVHLDGKERFMEGLRAFMHLTPSSYLEAKAINSQLIEEALVFLKKHTSIQRYVFPAVSSSLQLPQDNQVFLQEKQSIKLDLTVPDKFNEGTLFCLPGELESESYAKSSEGGDARNLETTYLCDAALGIEFYRDRSGNITLIDLNEGNDKAIGMPNLPNIFQVKNGHKHYKGGDVENLFIIQDENITGILIGGNGLNVIKLENIISDDIAYALFDKKAMLCLKNTGALADQCDEEGLQLKYIQHIYGNKNKKDIIFINEDVKYIDGLGGKSHDEKDHIYFTSYFPENFSLMLRFYTVIHAFTFDQVVNTSIIDYRLTPQSGSTLVQIDWNKSIHHRFNIEFSLRDLFVLFISENEIGLNFSYEKSFFNLKVMLLRNNYNALSFHFPSIQFLFKNQEFSLTNDKYLFIREFSNRTIGELVEEYLSLSLRLQLVIQLYRVEKKQMLQISHNQYAVLSNQPTVKNFLISQSEKTIFLIKPSLKKTDFRISEIVIYSLGEKNFSNTLDLREVRKQIKKICVEAMVVPEIVEVNQDLLLTLKVNYRWLTGCVSLESFWPIVTIKLRNALLDNAYQNLEILLYNIPAVIALNEQKKWYFEAYPLVFSYKKNLILITKDDLFPGVDILVLKRGGNGTYDFFCHKEVDLILTNSFDPLTQADELCTIIYSQFYRDSEMRELTLAGKFTLIDQQIILKEQKEKINNAPCVDLNKVNLTHTFTHHFFNDHGAQSSESLNNNRRLKRQAEVKNNSSVKNKIKSDYQDVKNISKFKIDFFQALPKRNAFLPSRSGNFYHSASGSLPSPANDAGINNQSIFFSWVYHTLLGKKAKPLNFSSIEIENENQVYRAIDKFERLQNQTSYYLS